jgi:small subunit ribosomal protein S20
MANHSATKKSIRKTINRTHHRGALISAVKTSVRRFNEALKSGDKGTIQTSHQSAQSTLMKASKRNLLHKNTVSRKIARLTKKMKATL